MVALPSAIAVIFPSATVATAGLLDVKVHLPSELEVGASIDDGASPTVMVNGANVPIVGVVPKMVTENPVEALCQIGVASWVIVTTAVPAPTMCNELPLTATTDESELE